MASGEICILQSFSELEVRTKCRRPSSLTGAGLQRGGPPGTLLELFPYLPLSGGVPVKQLIAFFLLFTGGTLAAQQPNDGTSQEKFISGGMIRMHLEAGGYTIRPSDSANIVVKIDTDSERELSRVKVAIKTGPSTADIYIHNTPDHNFRAIIEVPRKSNLWVRLSAGQLTVGAVEGDKNLEIRAGQMEVEVPNPDDYGHRDASVWTGAIEASAFNISKGGLFRSFEQNGAGKFRLHAHIMSGEIDLRR